MRSRTLLLALLSASLLTTPSLAQDKKTFANVTEALQASGAMGGRSGPRGVNWIDGGNRYSYTTRGADGEEIRATNPATGSDTLLFSAKDVTFPDTAAPFSYQSFQFAQDSKHLVFQTRFKQIYRRSGRSDYFVYSLTDKSMQLAAKGAQTGELSPDGSLFGYELGGDLYVRDLGTNVDKRLTTGASETLHNGRFDWVYEEEFGMAQAWNWSPDSRHLAYWQVDESAEPFVQLTDFEGAHPEWDKLRIPQPGDSNPKVRIGVVNVATGKQVWLDTKATGDFYIPRIYWTSAADTLAVLELNRKQNTLRLFFFNVNDAGSRLVRTWTSDTWLDVYDFYAGIQDMMTFPAGSREFFWISDQDGWQHIYRYDYSGKLINQITSGPYTVTRIEGTDPGRKMIYFSSTEDSPLQRQLYAVRYDGKGKKRLTTTTGTHAIDMAPNAKYYIDRWSSSTQPRQVELWATGGKMLKQLEDNAAVTEWMAKYAYAPVELFQFTTSDGQKLDGSMIKPPDFDPAKRYPVILAIYGGPGSQQVYDRFASNGMDQWRAQQGYIIVGVNNRGSNNYGSAFMKQVYRHLGKYEAMDFAETAQWLAKQSFVDGSRIAIDGTSYGGYSVLYTMAAYPEVFAAGIANSAVTDWRLYDTIYAERYMDILPDNAAGYDSSAVNPRAGRIKGKLLVIHSMMDDNVHPVNTMQFITAATDAGVDVDLRIYPPGRHGAAYNFASFKMIQDVADRFLARTIGTGASAQGGTR
jgi:dipeptidyl-peptidase-4